MTTPPLPGICSGPIGIDGRGRCPRRRAHSSSTWEPSPPTRDRARRRAGGARQVPVAEHHPLDQAGRHREGARRNAVGAHRRSRWTRRTITAGASCTTAGDAVFLTSRQAGNTPLTVKQLACAIDQSNAARWQTAAGGVRRGADVVYPRHDQPREGPPAPGHLPPKLSEMRLHGLSAPARWPTCSCSSSAGRRAPRSGLTSSRTTDEATEEAVDRVRALSTLLNARRRAGHRSSEPGAQGFEIRRRYGSAPARDHPRHRR